MKAPFYKILFLCLFIPHCLAMSPFVLIQVPGALGAPVNSTVHPLYESPIAIEFEESEDLVKRLQDRFNMGKITRRLMSLRDLLKNDARIHGLVEGYHIRIMPFVVLPDNHVKDFILGMGLDLKQLLDSSLRNVQKDAGALDGAATLEKLGALVADVFEMKLEREKRRSWSRSIIYRPGKLLQYVLGDTLIPERLKTFLAEVLQAQRAESEKLTNLDTRLSHLTGLAVEECGARIAMILDDSVRLFDDIERICEYAKSFDNVITVESGERTLDVADTCDQVLCEPDMPRLIRGIFGMLVHQLRDVYTQGSKKIPHCSVLLKTVIGNSCMYKEKIVLCESKEEHQFNNDYYAFDLMGAIEHLIFILKEQYCKEPTLLRFVIDPVNKMVYVVDAIPIKDNNAATKAYLKKKGALEASCEKLTPKEMFELGAAHLFGEDVKKDCKIALKYLKQVADQTENSEFNAHANLMLGALYFEGNCVKQDYKKARMFYEQVTKADHVALRGYGLSKLAEIYLEGLGVDQDIEKALMLMKQAATIHKEFLHKESL